MKKIMKIGPILLVAFVAVAFAFPAQALITNADIANNAGISHSKLKLGGKIDSDDIKDGSIRSKDIKNGTVSSNDIKNGTIQSEDIEDGTITADDLVASFIASSQIVDDSIVNADINSAAGIVYSKLAFSNNIVAGDIATGAVTTTEILDGTIATGDISTGGVTSGNILNGTIAGGDLATNIAITTSGTANFTGDVTLGSDGFDVIVDSDAWFVDVNGNSWFYGITNSSGVIYANGGIANTEAEALAINANGAQKIILGGTSTGDIDLTRNVNALAGLDVTGALTVSTTSTLTGNVDAQDGLDVTGGAMTFNGTAGSWTVAEADSALTQTGTGQVTFTGNVDATNGLDVTVADLTVGGANFGVTVGNGNVATAGTVTAAGVVNANGGIANTEAEALAINANGAQKIILGGTSTGDIDLTRNVNALAGLDVTGALTVSTTSTLTGNVDAQDGLDVTGGAMTFNGTAGSWTVAEADSALTQTGTGQVTFTGNVDATNGLDVTVADLTVGGANFGVTVGNGNVATAGTVTAAGVVNANGGIANTEAEALAINANGAQKIILGGTSTGDIDLTRNVNALAGLDVTGALTVSTTADVTGLANLNGGIAVDTSNFTVDGTNGDVLTAGDLDVNGNDIDSSGSMDITGATGMNINTGAGDITLDPAGNDVLPGGDSADNLGADATRWSAIYADTLNYATALTDGGATNVTTVTLGTSAADAVTINANTAITDDNWSVSNAGAAAFASATVNGVNVVTAGTGTGNVNSTMILDGTITADDLAANSVDSSEIVTDAVGSSEIAESAVGSSEIANSSVSNVDLADDAVTSSKIYDGTITGSDLASNIAITTSGTFSSSGTVNFSGATSVRIPSGTATPGTCSVGELFVDTNGNSETITSGNADNTATVYMYVCTSSNVWTPVVKD